MADAADGGAGEKKTGTYMKWTEPQTHFMLDLAKARSLHIKGQDKTKTIDEHFHHIHVLCLGTSLTLD